MKLTRSRVKGNVWKLGGESRVKNVLPMVNPKAKMTKYETRWLRLIWMFVFVLIFFIVGNEFEIS